MWFISIVVPYGKITMYRPGLHYKITVREETERDVVAVHESNIGDAGAAAHNGLSMPMAKLWKIRLICEKTFYNSLRYAFAISESCMPR